MNRSPLLLPARCASRSPQEGGSLPQAPLRRADEPGALTAGRRSRGGRPVWRWSFGASLVIHAVLLVVAAIVFASTAPTETRGPAIAHVTFEAPTEVREDEPQETIELDRPDPLPLEEEELIPISDIVLPEDELLEVPEEVEFLPPEASPFEVPLDVARKRLRTVLRPPPEPPPPVRPAARRPPPPKPRLVAAPRPKRRAPAKLRVLYAPRPGDFYPYDARRRGVQGTVSVVFMVSEQGGVFSAQIERSSGSSLLDAAAVQFVRAFRFAPPGVTRRGRLPVAFLLR